LFEELHGRISVVDYQHAELEGDGSIGTVFDNEGVEGRFTAHLNTKDDIEGVVGVQFSDREFAAIGEEAFIPATDINSLALFTLQSIALEKFVYEFGLRAEYLELEQAGKCDNSSTNWSGSMATIWRIREDSNLLFSVNHSQRSATVEELYSNIDLTCSELETMDLTAHAVTQRLEIGLPGAKREKSTNFEFDWRKYAGNFTAEINFFYNDIDDFIYLFDTNSFVNDVEISRYRQEKAKFKGVELQLSLPLYRTGAHHSNLTLFSDYVDARFKNSVNMPRIPPWRYGFEWAHAHVDWSLKLRWSQAGAQSNYAPNETRTSDYQLLSLYGDYRKSLSSSVSLLVFAKGHNLLNESIRYHTSLLKDVAPAPGRGVEVGLRLEF